MEYSHVRDAITMSIKRMSERATGKEAEVNSKDQPLGHEQALEGRDVHVTAAWCGC